VEEDRRAFLKKMAKGSIYSVPLIRTLSTPPELAAMAAQMGSMKGGWGAMGSMLVAPTGGGFGGTSTAPWARPRGG
jgi:hypothetical protein